MIWSSIAIFVMIWFYKQSAITLVLINFFAIPSSYATLWPTKDAFFKIRGGWIIIIRRSVFIIWWCVRRSRRRLGGTILRRSLKVRGWGQVILSDSSIAFCVLITLSWFIILRLFHHWEMPIFLRMWVS